MDEEERNKKLRAGKEKLAAFQKKKSKKKHGHHHERSATSLDHPIEMADSSSIDQSSSSDFPLFEDSDQNVMSEDEMTTQDSKSLFKAQAKLKQATERIVELEESLEGKQLALDRVISENTKLKETSLQEKMREMEMALCKRDEIIRQLTSRLQSAASLEADAAQLGQHVQQLQTQLINAGKLMESQNYKQSLSSQALMEAKNEIETLQKCIEDKDNLLTQLSEKVNAISTEYIGLKTSYVMSRQKEEESAKVVKSLMSDAEELRKQASMNGSVNISSPDSDVEIKVQEVRLELEETYGKQITVMKEELSKHYQAQIETLSCELNNVKQVCATLENQQEILQQEKQTLTTSNETYTLVVSELETKLAEVNSRLDEVQNEKEEILILNETLNKQINVVNKEDVQFENENRQQEEQVLLTRKEIVSEEVEKINSITELNEKNLKLSTELENLRTEYVEAKKLIDNLQKKGKGGRSQQFQVDSQEIVMELKQVTEQYEEALVNIAMMQARIEDYDIKCENLNDDLLKLKEKYVKSDEAMKNNEERLKEYEEKQDSMVLEKQEMMEKWKNAQKQCEEYRDKFVEYEQQLTDYEGLMIQFNELQHECNVYQTHNDELNNKMNIQQDVVVELKAELEVLTNQNQAYQEQALLQTQQLGEISQENKSLQESVSQHKDELTTLTNSFNLVTAEVDVYREKANSLETMVENLNKELQMKGDAEFESKQKDVLIQELTSKISDLTSALKSDHDHLHKETVLHEECSMQKEVSLHEESLAPLSNEECLSALENQIIATDNVQNQSDEIDSRNIDKSGGMLQPVQIIQLEASVTSSEVPFNLIGHQEINEHQSELQLGAGMEVGRDMDADSLDDNESTRTIDSIEDSSHRRNDLMTRISDLHGQNQSLVSDYKTLSDENLELKMNMQKLNDELVEMSGSKSDFEQIVQTFKSIIDKMEAEKAEMEISWKSTEECNLALSEKLKYEESNLTVVEEEKMALQSELTFMNSIINEISQTEDVSQDDALLGALHVDEGLSQTASTSHVDEGLSQTASTNMCNKLQTVKQNVNTLHQECDQLKVEILEINEIHRNELLQRQEENDNLRKELGWLEHQINYLKADEEKSKESQTTEIKILQTENDNLNQKLVEMGEREQNLRVQVDRLSQQVFELSVINQTVSGDKENLENRFVEVSAKENDALEGEVISLSGECQVLSSTISHDLFVANQQIFPVAGKDDNDLNEKIDREVSGEMETQTNGEKDTASLDGSVNLKVVTTSLSAGSLETLSTSTADQSTDQSTTLETLKKQYEVQLDSLRQELDTERQARAGDMEDTQSKEDKLEKLDTADKETVDEVITVINTQHATEIEHLQLKYLEDVDLKVKAMRITLEQIYTSQIDLVQTELEKKRVQSLKDLHDQLTKEHEEDIQRIEMLWEKRLEDIEDQHDDEMNKSLLEESLSTKESASAQIQKAIKKMSQEHDVLLQKISDGLNKSPKIRTPRKKKQNQEQQTEDDETDTESIRSMPVTEEEYQHLEETEKIVDKAEDVRRTLENQREELDHLRACLLQEYEQLLSARTASISTEAQEVERLQEEMNQLHRMYKQKAKEQPVDDTASDFSKLKAQYENKISTLEKYHQEDVLKYRDEIEKLREDSTAQTGDSASDVVTSPAVQDARETERDYVKNTYTMTVISDDDSIPSPRSDDTGAKSLQELKTLLAKREDEISDLQLKITQDNIELQELQFKMTESSDKIQELENKLRVSQSELDEVNSLVSDKDCKIESLMKQKQGLGEKCLRELEESENKHAKIVTEINEKFEKVLSELKTSQAEVSKLRSELEASQEQEKMLEEQYDELQQKQNATMKNSQQTSEHDYKEIISELKLKHEKELESLKEKHTDELDSLSEKHKGDLELLKETLHSTYQEQIEELQHQQKLNIESIGQDLEHENQVELGTIQTEFKVQMEIELKRQAADIALEHENEIKNLKTEYEQKIQEIKSEQKSAVLEKAEAVEEPIEMHQAILEEKIEKTFSPREERGVFIEDEDSQVSRDSDTQSQETVIELSKFEDTVMEAKIKSEGDTNKTEADADSLEEDKDIKDDTLSASLLQTDQSHDFDQIDSSQDFDQTASSRDFTQTASTLDSATSSDSSEKGLPLQGHDNTVAVLMQEIARAKDETVKQLQEEYQTEINQLHAKLKEATDKNSKLEENFKEEMDKIIESHEAKFKEVEESSKVSKEEIEKQNSLKRELIKKHEDSIDNLNREYEEKMELLKQELMETFDSEKDELKKKHEADLYEAEEKYETLIDRIKSGEAPEVADIIHERYDSELEMAKSLMQQEFDETIESEQARFMEQHQELMDKFIVERQAEADDLRMQHEKDIAECRKTIIEEYDAKINELEQNQESEIVRLKEEMAKIVPAVADESPVLDSQEPVDEPDQDVNKDQDGGSTEGGDDLPSDPEVVKQRSSAEMDDSIEDLRETHTAIIARIEAEYEEKLKRIKEEMASIHSDDVDGGSIDTAASRKGVDQHKQELLVLEQQLAEKHNKEIQNLQTQHQARIEDIEEKYKKEIGNLKKILEFLQHSSSSEDTIHGQLVSPAQTVPMLEGLEEEIVQEVSGRYVPSRSTPRDDMESSIERVEVTERVKRPQQISPRDKKEIITDESPVEPSIEFDRFRGEKPEEDSGSEVSEDPILPLSAPPRELQISNFDFDAGLDERPRFVDEDDDFDRSGSYDERDDSFRSGRSTPTDLLQTRALADTLANFKPVATYESGDLPVSSDVVKQKEGKIKELEDEVQKLTMRLQDQIEEERLILMRRERESQEGQNLELMLKSDLERVNDDRESVQRTNEQLLQLLSDSVKTYLNVEDSINKKLSKMVAEGDKSGGSKGRTPPKDQERAPAAAEGGEGDGDSLQETSILSNVTDEGLDLSQRISESIFQGPELDKDGEEILRDASHRLQNSVSRLLDMIEETTSQLLEARTTQHELVDHVNIRDEDSNQMNNQVQELQDQLREEITAKEYLAVELHKAEGLIEGYSSEREALNQQISDLEEKKEALVLELETTKNKLQDLESIHHEAVSLRSELQRQQALMQNNVGEEAQGFDRYKYFLLPFGVAVGCCLLQYWMN